MAAAGRVFFFFFFLYQMCFLTNWESEILPMTPAAGALLFMGRCSSILVIHATMRVSVHPVQAFCFSCWFRSIYFVLFVFV
jgi:hypothetical protein